MSDWSTMPGRVRDSSCELCEEARMTEWFYEDEDCWIAECEACSVPMVVWRNHDANPTDSIKADLRRKLGAVVTEHFDFEHIVDDNMRSIGDHYHAHARPRGAFFGHGLRRKSP